MTFMTFLILIFLLFFGVNHELTIQKNSIQKGVDQLRHVSNPVGVVIDVGIDWTIIFVAAGVGDAQ